MRNLGGIFLAFFSALELKHCHMSLYAKPASSLPALYAKITSRGLSVENPDELKAALENLGYYRIGGYAYPFLTPPDRKLFKPGTTWNQIARIYEFDRELRLLVSDAIERIEVALRARLVSATTMEALPSSATASPGASPSTWGPHWYLDASRFHPKFDHVKFIANVEKEVGVKYDPTTRLRILPANHAEKFIEHYYAKYGDPCLPPFWMVAEVLTLGSLSLLYNGLGDPSLKARIALPFGLTAKVMANWLHCLSHLRNICAHHGRLWNRTFSISPKVPPHLAATIRAPNRFEGHARLLMEMLRVTAPTDNWKTKFRALLARFPEIDPSAMGFDSSWAATPKSTA